MLHTRRREDLTVHPADSMGVEVASTGVEVEVVTAVVAAVGAMEADKPRRPESTLSALKEGAGNHPRAFLFAADSAPTLPALRLCPP